MTCMVNEYKLECYHKIKSIGENGNLWIVEDSVTQNRFVMRKLPMDSQRVYQRLASIHHINIVEITDIFIYNGFLYVIEEYLSGELLSDVINTTKLSRRSVFSIGEQLLNALSVLHKYNIVHRDIKPENIMIDTYGNVKLIDFDIARIFTPDKNNDTTLKGSRDYAPPEQFGFAQSDQRTDIYSLGVTLNELAVGRFPEEKMCTGKLGIIIRRCIEFDPRRRYQSASQALKHMHRLEKKTILFALSAIILFFLFLFILITPKIFISNNKWSEIDEQASEALARFPVTSDVKPTISNTGPKSDTLSRNFSKPVAIFDSTEYQDRIIYVQDASQYPAFLMTENKEYGFSADLRHDVKFTGLVTKEDEQLFLICKLPDDTIVEFKFDDVFSDIYIQQGYYNNIEFEKTSPEYEILLNDLDENGTIDLLVTLAWRYRVDTPDPVNRYYLTEYSILWIIYLNEDKELVCSEPLYFNGNTPTLQTDTLIYDSFSTEWHTFQNGIWH